MKPHLLIAAVFLTLLHCAWSDPVTNISSLPGHIKAPASGLALIADYDHPSNGAIPVYLINRTGKDISLPSQDGDIFLKLEYQTSDGQWKRAQPHAYSWCGNSFFALPPIHSDQFIVIHGYQPAQGFSAKIRFRIYGKEHRELVSNAAQGLARLEDIEKARNDAMAVGSGDFEFVESVARGKLVLHNTMDHISDLRVIAMAQLGSGRFDRAKAGAVLRDIVARNEDRYSQFAEAQLNALKYHAEHPQ